MSSFEQTLEYLYAQLPIFQQQGGEAIKKGLANTLELLETLGNPHRSCRYIHIAGTNGKGTTAHSLASIYQEAGYKVGLYTSPHLVEFTERIKVNGEEVHKQWVVDFIERLKPEITKVKPSFFEVTVVMSLQYFVEKRVDLAIIEVGMGGRLDSTNVIDPMVSVITNIGLDHQQYLGNTIAEIAGEKAGIIKHHKPIVLGHLLEEALEVAKQTARDRKAPIFESEKIYLVDERKDNGLIVYYRGHEFIKGLTPSLRGRYFLKNLPAILTTVQVLGKEFPVRNIHIKTGIEKTVINTGLQGRWQILNESPITICDIGHNEDGIRAIVNQMSSIPFDKLIFVIGVMRDKDLSSIVGLLPKYATYFTCEPNIPRSLDSSLLCDILNEAGLVAFDFATVEKAYVAAQRAASLIDAIFIGGSTFVVAEVLKLLKSKDEAKTEEV